MSTTCQRALDEVEKRTPELTKVEESVRIETQKKVSLGKRRIQARNQLSQLAEKKRRLNEERDEARRQLELRKQELHFLRLHQHTNDEKWKAIIACKEVEIENLKKRLAKVKTKLRAAKDESDRLHMQLQQTTVELAKQSERVRGLEQTLASLERERRQVDTKIIIEIAKNEVSNFTHDAYFMFSSLIVTSHLHECTNGNSNTLNSQPLFTIKSCYSYVTHTHKSTYTDTCTSEKRLVGTCM